VNKFNELNKNADVESMAYSIDYKKRAVEYKDARHTFEELKIPPV
jgi:hypothetical protein